MNTQPYNIDNYMDTQLTQLKKHKITQQYVNRTAECTQLHENTQHTIWTHNHSNIHNCIDTKSQHIHNYMNTQHTERHAK